MNLIQECIASWDSAGYYPVLTSFDKQITDGRRLLEDALKSSTYSDLKKRSSDIRHIVLCGMGGSAIAGDFIRSLYYDCLSLPFIVCRDYVLPSFVSEQTLILASSYSGTTEETLSALAQAQKQKAIVVTLSSGGAMADIARQQGYFHLSIPKGYQPRQVIGYALTFLHGLMAHLFWNQLPDEDFCECENYIVSKKAFFSDERNPFVAMAASIRNQPVILYASERMYPVALRLKGQINENAKWPAFANAVPEMNHNEIVGWQTIEKNSSPNFSVILLRDPHDHPKVKRRFDLIEEILNQKTMVHTITSEGTSLFTRFMSLIYSGDWLSYYMAILHHQDPTPVDIITELKRKLSD